MKFAAVVFVAVFGAAVFCAVVTNTSRMNDPGQEHDERLLQIGLFELTNTLAALERHKDPPQLRNAPFPYYEGLEPPVAAPSDFTSIMPSGGVDNTAMPSVVTMTLVPSIVPVDITPETLQPAGEETPQPAGERTSAPSGGDLTPAAPAAPTIATTVDGGETTTTTVGGKTLAPQVAPLSQPVTPPVQAPSITPPVAAPIQAPSTSQPVTNPIQAPSIFQPIVAPVAMGSADGCPDVTGCDICPDGPIADDSLSVTITIPGTTQEETATCADWFETGCTLVQPENCTAFQGLLTECCGATASIAQAGSASTSSAPSGDNFMRQVNRPITKEAPSPVPSVSFSPTVSMAPSESPIAVS